MTLVVLSLLVIVIPCIIVARLKVNRRYKGPPSQHFDGRRFYNETGIRAQSLWTAFKWMLNRDHSPWSKKIIPSANYNLPNATEKHCVVTFVNHASSLIQTGKINILTDPQYSDRASPFSFAGPYRVHEPGIAYDKLPKIDVVIISHDHYDHMDKRTLKMLYHDHKPLFLVGLGNDVHLKSFGITENVKTLDWWQPIQIANTVFTFVPAQHFSGRGLLDHNTTLWGGFVLHIEKAHLFFAGDTGYGPHFKTIHDHFGPMDLSMLPIGSYCPRWFMQPVHVNPEEAVLAHLDLQSKKSIGIHYKTFPMSDEPYEQPVIDLEAAKKKYNIPNDAFIAPDFGQSFIVSKH
jgi:L-ascorbate metabolism protein UlaG (beta-lactamase superfamily)